MSDQATPPPAPGPAALVWRVAGGLLCVLAVLLVVKSLRAGYVEYRFNTLAPAAESNPTAVRLEYAAALRRLLEIEPGHSAVRGRLANVLASLGQNEEAIRELTRALQTQRAQNSLDALAQMYERVGRLDEAIATLQSSTVMNPYTIETNQALLRLLNQRLDRLKAGKEKSPAAQREIAAARQAFALQAANWNIRAYADPNAKLFMGNHYIEPLYPLQAYRTYLEGLSLLQQSSGGTRYQLMIAPQSALGTVGQILRGRYVRPYRGLP